MSWSFLDFTGLSRFFGRLPEKLVTTDTTQTISGTKSFSSTILGSVSGSAASASKDGAGNVIADTYETKEDAATHLSKSDAAGTYLSKTDAASTCVQTGAVDQTVAGTKTFSKPIVGSVTGSSGSCTGNAATATKLATATSLWGNDFDGSAAVTGIITGTPGIEFKPGGTTATHGGFLDFHYNNSTADHTSRIIEFAPGMLSINGVAITTGKVVTAATFNGALKGNVTGNCSGSSGSCTGNAATATKLAAERTINGTAFNGTANITTANWGTARDITIADSTGDNTGEAVSVNGSAAVTLKLPATIKASLDGNAATATSATTAASATTATNATNAAKLGNIASSGYVQTGKVNQTIDGTKTFSAAIVGSVTGNAGSATKLATARTVNGTNFDGTANITTANWGTARNISITDGTNTSTAVSVNGSANVSLNLPGTIKATFVGNITGNVTGDVTGNCSGSSSSCTGNAATATTATTAEACTGNAASATKLQTARTINGTSFNGTANITTANWGTARNISIADATATNTGEAVSVNGSAAVTLKLPAAIKANVTGSCTGNAATATKLATARTIALSGAATGTATAFDGSGNITIPVTALAASAIRAQWYAAYPDGAEAHNAMWGGRDITAAFDSGEFSEHVADGTFKDIFPGDYITKQVTIPQVLADDGTTVLFDGGTYTVNWVIADCDYWINKGDTAMTAHHVVIVPQAPIFNANMNDTNTTEGGYAGSRMYRETIPACATGIVNAFGSSHILTFRDAITNSVDTSHASSSLPQYMGTPGWFGEWVSVQCNLMSEKMVYGAPICAAGAMDNTMATRQMSAFRLSERLINYTRWAWWLRDVVSSARFADVGGRGYADALGASTVFGVRPFALLK